MSKRTLGSFLIITRMYDSIYKEVLIMRVKFTTTLNSKLLEKIKIKAVEEKTDVSKILEKLIILYLIDK